GDTTIEAIQGAARTKAIDGLAQLVKDAEQMNLRVYTVGIGSAKGGVVADVKDNGQAVVSKLDPAPLQKIASVGRGKYYDANSNTSLGIAEAIHNQMLQDPPYYDERQGLVAGSLLQAAVGESSLIYDRYFQYPLAIAVALLLLAYLLPVCWQG